MWLLNWLDNEMSHSTRVRGLKYSYLPDFNAPGAVALYTSAWIEIATAGVFRHNGSVALYTSAWIEISSVSRISSLMFVALYTSAWIEIFPNPISPIP